MASKEPATEEIDLIILASELVASEEAVYVQETIWELPSFHLLVLHQSELILSLVELPFPVLMSNWVELKGSTYSQMFSWIAMKNQLWLQQKKRAVRVAPQETSTVTSKSRVTFVFPKKLLSLKIQ